MSIHLTPPRTAQPLLAALQKQKAQLPRLSDYPALAVAATATTADLDTDGEIFASISACLETLARLRLSASSTWLLMLLVKHGPQTHTVLAARMKCSSPSMTQLTARLESLSLITIQRGQQPDRRAVLLTATEAARKVLASIVALSGLGAAAATVLQIHTPKKPHA